jgi:hypothetical protein
MPQPGKRGPHKKRGTESNTIYMAESNSGQVFKPGEECPLSGVYRVVHDPVPTKEHEVTCVYGKKFPPCNSCGHDVRFVLKPEHIRWR